MIKTLLKKLDDKASSFIAGWAYFVGSVMADAFQERLEEIHSEECEECNTVDDLMSGAGDKPVVKPN